jgi:hypothetical protein
MDEKFIPNYYNQIGVLHTHRGTNINEEARRALDIDEPIDAQFYPLLSLIPGLNGLTIYSSRNGSLRLPNGCHHRNSQNFLVK